MYIGQHSHTGLNLYSCEIPASHAHGEPSSDTYVRACSPQFLDPYPPKYTYRSPLSRLPHLPARPSFYIASDGPPFRLQRRPGTLASMYLGREGREQPSPPISSFSPTILSSERDCEESKHHIMNDHDLNAESRALGRNFKHRRQFSKRVWRSSFCRWQ